MATHHVKRAIGLFSNQQEAQSALTTLRDSGFPMHRVSIITHQPSNRREKIAGIPISTLKTEQIKGGTSAGAMAGGATGALIGLISSLSLLALSGLGAAAELGFFVGSILLGSGFGIFGGGLIGTLIGWGVPEAQSKYYDEHLAQGEFLVVVKGTTTEIRKAAAILNQHSVRDWNVYGASEHAIAQ